MKKAITIILLLMGVFLSIFLFYNKKEDIKALDKNNKETYDNYNKLYGTIIYKDDSNFEVITSNSSLYKFNYSSDNFNINDNIEIIYENDINDFNEIQDIDIIKINKIKELKYDSTLDEYRESAIKLLKDMSLEEKVGQLLLARVPESNKIEDIKKYNLGGYILFGRDVKNKTKDELKNEINSYKTDTKVPLFIAIDEEGGTVTRLSSNKSIVSSPFLSPQELYNKGGIDEIINDTKRKDSLLSELGINMNLAPVADVVTDSNSFMYDRSFGKDATSTSEYIESVFRNQTKDVTYTLKHFPGYGNNSDTHTGIAIDEREYDSFVNNDFLPFIAGIKNNAMSILVSHNTVVSIENKPASISKNMHNILRNELNYDGIIMTDDLSMGAAIEYNTDSLYVDAVKAGNNLLIVTDYKTAYNDIYNAVNNNIISESLIDNLIIKNIELKLYKEMM